MHILALWSFDSAQDSNNDTRQYIVVDFTVRTHEGSASVPVSVHWWNFSTRSRNACGSEHPVLECSVRERGKAGIVSKCQSRARELTVYAQALLWADIAGVIQVHWTRGFKVGINVRGG